ncbi:MAG TPA: hypothetical protein VJH55_00345 [Candidatus Paceibacterota bacterium]
MRPKIIIPTIVGAILLLLAIWSIAPKAPNNLNVKEPQPVARQSAIPKVRLPRAFRQLSAQEEVSTHEKSSNEAEVTIPTNSADVPEGYKRITFAVSGSDFAVKPSTNHVSQKTQ